MTINSIRMTRDDDVPDIDVDIDDNGYAYIKQEGDWIAFPKSKVPVLISILKEIY